MTLEEMNSVNLLEVRNLTTHFFTRDGVVKVVNNVNLTVGKGQSLGLAGESGCGKTTLALSIMRLLPSNGKIVDGQVIFDGKDLARISADELRKLRWKEISIIFQGAMNALNPVRTIGYQISEVIRLHQNSNKGEALARTKKLLGLVGISPTRVGDYPHQLSGGMRQRAMIAMALACDPKLVIADEPVTALDVMVQAQILELIARLRKELNLSMILITHDLSVIAETCDNVAIMYAGIILEYADVETLFENAAHPYTQRLIEAFPRIDGSEMSLSSIPGAPPDLINPPRGCRFYPRCSSADTKCKEEEPTLVQIGANHYVACHKAVQGSTVSAQLAS